MAFSVRGPQPAHCPSVGVKQGGGLLTSAICVLSRVSSPSTHVVLPEPCAVGSSAQNGSALKREFSGGSYSAKRQPMPSPSEGSLSSGGMDQGSDAPARDYDGEVSACGEQLRLETGSGEVLNQTGKCIS